MVQLELEATVLGRLLVIQETLDVLPNPASMAAFLDAAMAEVPGVEGAHLWVNGSLMPGYPDLETLCRDAFRSPGQIAAGPYGSCGKLFFYPLRIAVRFYGILVLRLADSSKFECYRAFLGNIANVVARTLENRVFVQQLADTNRLLEQKVARQQLTLSAIVASSDDAIIGKKLDGTITHWNKAAERMYGYAAEEILGQPVFRLAPPELHAEIGWYLAEVAAGRAVRNLDTRRIRKDGSLFDVSLTISPICGLNGEVVGSSAIARDITERKQADEALRRVNRNLKMLSSCNGVLVRAVDEGELLRDMCRHIVEIGGYGTAWVGLISSDAGAGDPMVCYGYGPGFDRVPVISNRCDCPDSMLRYLVDTGVSHVLHGLDTHSPMFPLNRRAIEMGYEAVAIIPVRSSAGWHGGILGLYAETPEAFDGSAMALLEELADDMAYGIANLRDQAERLKDAERLARSLEDTIQAVASTLEKRDPYTAGHQRRVADLAAAIARELAFGEDEIRGIHLAGMVHDIGKISIPLEILTKPGCLTALEFEYIKTHSEAGYEILKGVEFPWPIADMIRQHHERLDGSGYPQGLAGDAIIQGARIIAVADVVESMVAHRPYRPGLGIDAALREIESRRGQWFDENVADACARLFRDRGYLL